MTHSVIGACIEVHRCVGPGLLESAYEACLAQELSLRRLRFERQRVVPVVYKGVRLGRGYRLDFVVEDSVVVEVKAVEALLPVHEAQVITYLKLTGLRTGLLVNFHAETIRGAVRRLSLEPQKLPASPSPCQIQERAEGGEERR